MQPVRQNTAQLPARVAANENQPVEPSPTPAPTTSDGIDQAMVERYLEALRQGVFISE